MGYFRDSRRIVVKVGTSTLTHATGHLNLRRIEKLVKVLSDMKNSGIQVVLVSSGAVSAGVAKLGFGTIPDAPEIKQAMAAVGQSELMKIYDKLFSVYGHTVAQILMTKDVLTNPDRKSAAVNTFNRLLEMNCLPIVNENDSVSVAEIKFGDNDTLAGMLGAVLGAELTVILTTEQGLRKRNADGTLGERISVVEKLTPEMIAAAGDTDNSSMRHFSTAFGQFAHFSSGFFVILNNSP